MNQPLYLIDGSGFIFRAFHALPPMTRGDGTHVNAVYGFCTMVQRMLADSKATHIAVIFDAGRTTFRSTIYPEYKAHRPPPPPELVPQFALIREATRAFGLPAIELEGYEADDLIAAYATAALKAGQTVRIISSDKDLMQLLRTGVEMFDPLKSTPIGEAEVLKKFGVAPNRVTDVQALAGDSTDNIPGVPSIGVKTAAELITQFGDLETLLANASTIKQPKRRETLMNNIEAARISKKLVTLDDTAPLPAPLEDLVWNRDHAAELRAFLEAQGFRSLLSRLGGTASAPSAPPAPTPSPIFGAAPQSAAPTAQSSSPAPSPQPAITQHYELVQDEQALAAWVERIHAAGIVAVDTETNSLTPSTATLVGISLATAAGVACYIPVGHIDPQTTPDDGTLAFDHRPPPKQIPAARVAALLRPIFADPSILKIGHNLKYDMQVFTQHDLPITAYDDTMLMSYVLDAGLHGHGLDDLAALHCSHSMISYDAVTGTGKARVTFDRVPLDRATAYAAEDADLTLRLWHILKPRLVQEKLLNVYERLERPLVPVVAAMEQRGVLIDPALLRQQSHDLAQQMQSLETEIHALAGHPFNVASPKQLGEVLFDEMGIKGGVKGKTGAYSTSSDVLEPLAEQGHTLAAKVLDWRGLAKLKSTYTDALPEQISKKTGRVHTSFSLVGAATGRLSSTDPNLQNIPIRTANGRAIRRAFVAAEGYTLISADYSQIELRLAAEAAGITALIEAFQKGTDIHALTAAQVFGGTVETVTSDQRRAAKAINFGIIYGISGFGLAKQIGIGAGEANSFIRDYLDRFHELRDWMDRTKQFAHAHGYVETLFGRRVHIAGIHDKNGARRAGAERAAINAPLQGTAADIIKRAMIRMDGALAEHKLRAQLLLQVHDELIFEVPVEEVAATSTLVQRVMQEAPTPALTLTVPLVVEVKAAPNWADAH